MRRELVSIKREELDPNKIQGFVLRESEQLILISYVYDFKLDGLMVLRKGDITLLEVSETDKFQTQLLKDEGVFEKVNFDVDYNLSSWKEFIESAMETHKYFIIEEEELESPGFTIGTIESLDNESVSMRYFTGVGRWLEELEVLNFEDITSLQIGSNYLNVYERYFDRCGA
ncbi:hypothetical protein [Endozoicomonas sp. 4G]|uniref:hypothetical protein n=1 Tax=Endozoicomonas sp. 4G TaxID=2872754 RepID=UPI002078CC3A|nr:hypothetical protein [Endozoicomonas sp. 4G]